jgi:hypothetical protein
MSTWYWRQAATQVGRQRGRQTGEQTARQAERQTREAREVREVREARGKRGNLVDCAELILHGIDRQRREELTDGLLHKANVK